MNRLFPLLLALLLLAGCGAKEDASRPSATEPPSATEAATAPPTEEPDPAVFDAIRAGIPYKEILEPYGFYVITETEEARKKLAEYLFCLALNGMSFASVDELPNEHIISTAVQSTRYCTIYAEDENYTPEIQPFIAPASVLLGFREEMFWLKEHVEVTVRNLYGDVSFTHQSFHGGLYRYLEPLGVYTPPHRGGVAIAFPVILGYEEVEERIIAETSYVYWNMDEYGCFDPDGVWTSIPEAEVQDFARTKAARYTVTVSVRPDGSFLIESQTPKE